MKPFSTEGSPVLFLGEGAVPPALPASPALAVPCTGTGQAAAGARELPKAGQVCTDTTLPSSHETPRKSTLP